MILGASADRAKFGNKAVRAYVRQGHTVLPVNPKGQPIEGVACFRRAADVPGPIDRVLVYLHAEVILAELPGLAARGDLGELWLNPGADEPEVVAAAERLRLNVVQACSIVDIGEHP